MSLPSRQWLHMHRRPDGARTLFSHEIPAEPAMRRTGLTVAVRKLNAVLPALMKAGARLEQVYDY